MAPKTPLPTINGKHTNPPASPRGFVRYCNQSASQVWVRDLTQWPMLLDASLDGLINSEAYTQHRSRRGDTNLATMRLAPAHGANRGGMWRRFNWNHDGAGHRWWVIWCSF